MILCKNCGKEIKKFGDKLYHHIHTLSVLCFNDILLSKNTNAEPQITSASTQ